MSQLTLVVRRSPRQARLAVGCVLVALAVLALVWIGRAGADQGGSTPAGISKTVSNVATGKADAVDRTGPAVCTSSTQFEDMPFIGKTFTLGGTASRPVIVLFQAMWTQFPESVGVNVRLAIDGVVQSGPADVRMTGRGFGEQFPSETNGFNFISDPLRPGSHFAAIQWHDNGFGHGCFQDASLIVLHK
jgi:hypothetical protein